MWYKCTSKIKLIDQVIPVHKRSCWIRSLDTARLILTCPVLAAFLCEDITKWFNGKGGAAIFFVWVQNKKNLVYLNSQISFPLFLKGGIASTMFKGTFGCEKIGKGDET